MNMYYLKSYVLKAMFLKRAWKQEKNAEQSQVKMGTARSFLELSLDQARRVHVEPPE